MRILLLFFLAGLLTAVAADPDPLRDGKIFDPALTLKQRAVNATPELDDAQFLVGQYDITLTDTNAKGQTKESKGLAWLHFFNRGHGIMERAFIADKDGKAWSAVNLLVYNPTVKTWMRGGADNHTLAARVQSGDLKNGVFQLLDVDRRGGGPTLTYSRHTLEKDGDGLKYSLVESTDNATWKPVRTISYKRRAYQANFLAGTAPYGQAAPDRLPKADQFDFIIGEWDAIHDMTFPNGQQAKWKANATAVHVLNGYGILEFNWFDTDPNLPNAATTLLRVFNPAMNRWESLYCTNRFNGLLFFGGAWETDKMVLTTFEVDAAAPNLSHFVFHTIAKDSYHWYAEGSRDAGHTWKKNWIIDFSRKEKP